MPNSNCSTVFANRNPFSFLFFQQIALKSKYTEAVQRCKLPPASFRLLLPRSIGDELCLGKENIVDGEPNPNSSRITDAENALKNEFKVVEEMGRETDKLLERGFFIPRLRWNPNAPGNGLEKAENPEGA